MLHSRFLHSFMKKTRIASIEFYRYLFMVVLLSWHGPFDSFKFKSGYLVVEFFFILSGYLLMDSFLRKPKTATQYTIDKLKRVYLEYFIALCFAFLYFGVLPDLIVRHSISIESIFKFISEALLIQNVGIFNGGFNYPMWYFCVLIVGGYFLYYLISCNKNLAIHFLIPIISLATLTYLCNLQNTFENFETQGVFYIPLFRGIAEMGIGIILCAFANSRYNKMHRSIWIDCLVIIAILLTFYIFVNGGRFDKFAIIIFSFLVYAGIWNKGFLHVIFEHPVWLRLGGVTYEMYLLHAILGSVAYRLGAFVNISIDNVCSFVIYVVVVTLLSFVFKIGCSKLQNMITARTLI